jgi:hypothetical protein
MGAVAVVRQPRPAAPPSSQQSARQALVAAPGGSQPSNTVAPLTSPGEPERAPIHRPIAPLPRRTEEPPPVVMPPPASSEATFPADPADAYDAENLRIRAARGLLQAGRTQEALVALERLRRELPNGELSQEREALSIEALRLLGRTAEARERASAFLVRYPRSPHTQTARRALE